MRTTTTHAASWSLARIVALLMTLTFGAALAQADDAASDSARQAGPEDPVIRIGDDETVTQREFDEEFDRAMRSLAAQQGVPYSQETREMFDRFRADFLNQLAIQRALLLEAEERGITVTDEEVDAQIDQAREGLGGEAEFETALNEFGYQDVDEFREASRQGLTAQRTADEIRSDIQLSDQDVQTFFEENRAQFGDQELEQARPQVEAALTAERLNQRFSDLLEQYGIETFPNRVATGDQGDMSREDLPPNEDGVPGAEDDEDDDDGAMN